MNKSNTLYHQYVTKMQQIADLKYASAVLQWDQETYLPPKGATHRGQQLTTLDTLAHKTFTAPAVGKLLDRLTTLQDLSPLQKKNVELSLRDYQRKKKLPAAFVGKQSKAIHECFHAWLDARKKNNFKYLLKPLDKLIGLKIQETSYHGYETHPYDALMTEYDFNLTVKTTDSLFATLLPQLTELIKKTNTNNTIDTSVMSQKFDRDNQWRFGLDLLKRIQFDFDAGRQDISEHPFTINFSSKDVRITTRIDEHDFGNMTWSCLHEGGHGLYEQGLPIEEYGLPAGEYCSLSIHESQSRLWENCIGRSQEFWQANFPLLLSYFPQQFNKLSVSDFYKIINDIKPSLIRTEADEITYHFHVFIRYEIEKMLINAELKTKEIPEFWNASYKKYLGLDVPDDLNGCLQDVHWSHGSFGYFPTYSLGSLYAAQFFQTMEKQVPELNKNIISGNYQPIVHWLQQHIYQFGRYYESGMLCQKATGELLNPDHFIRYASKKISDIYGN